MKATQNSLSMAMDCSSMVSSKTSFLLYERFVVRPLARSDSRSLLLSLGSQESNIAMAAKCMGTSGGTICCFPLMMMGMGGKMGMMMDELMGMVESLMGIKMEELKMKMMGGKMNHIKIVTK